MTDFDIKTFIGERVRTIRLSKNISSESLTDYLNISRASVVNIEKGRQGASIEILIKLSYLFKCDVSDFLPSASLIDPCISNMVDDVYKKSIHKATRHLIKKKSLLDIQIKDIENKIYNER